MDRFKFRVWCKSTGRYLSTKVCILFLTNYMRHPDDTRFEEFVIEQCTGLGDKNGTLIFEGDIVADEGELFRISWPGSAWALEDVTLTIGDELLYYINEKGLEIIGNIHENPELLEA